MAVGTGGQIFYVLFGVFCSTFAVYAHLIFFDHAGMRKRSAGCRVSEMAGGSAVNFFDIFVGKTLYTKMAFAAAYFSMDGLVIKLLIYVIEMLLSLFINPAKTGILMAQEAVFLVNSQCLTTEYKYQYNNC
jgi:hypothetical protein